MAFGTAVLRDARARESLLELDAAQAARLVRASARALVEGETLRGGADEELRSLRATGIAVSAVVRPYADR